MLEVGNLSLVYGLHRALDGVALTVGRGEIVTILGANGAGKTSLLKAIAGVVRTLPGKQVNLSGRDISALPAHEIFESGLALVPEGRGIFGDLTVKENLLLGANPKRARNGEAARREQVLGLFPRAATNHTDLALLGGDFETLLRHTRKVNCGAKCVRRLLDFVERLYRAREISGPLFVTRCRGAAERGTESVEQ